MKKSSLAQIHRMVAGVIAITTAAFTVGAQTTFQRPGNVVGTGTNAWSFMIMEGEDYDPATKVNADPLVGFTKVYGDAALTNSLGNPVLGTNTTASKGGALFGQTAFGQYIDKITYHVQFATPGTYYLYMRFTMFENAANANYLSEDSFFVPPDFGKDPQTDWPLSDRGGYCEGGLSTSGFLWILESCTGGARTNHSGNDAIDQAYYWEGNFHWNQCISSQFLNPDTQGVPNYPFQYVVTPEMVGVPLDFTIGYREGGVTPDLFLFSTHTNLMDQYSQSALDGLLVNKVSVQDPADVVGTGPDEWSYLVMEGEDYEYETNTTAGVGFTTVHAGDGLTNSLGNQVLGLNTTASQGGALFGTTAFGQYVDKITYQVQFAKTGTYYLYMRFTMFENAANANYLSEDSFFVPPDFGKDPQTDWPLSDRGGYCEGGLSTSGFLWIIEPGTGGARTNHSGNDGIDQAYYWEGNFHWNQCISSQFLNPDTQGVPNNPFNYTVTPAMVGKKLNFTIGYREGGVTPDLFLFSTHTNMMEYYTEAELDQLFTLPKLKIARTGAGAVLSWPASATGAGFILETTDNLTSPNWTLIPCPGPDVSNGRNSVTVDPGTGNGYYRLRKL